MNAILLSGGKNSRFGSNKALIDWGGKPLLEVLVNRVSEVADEVIVVTQHPKEYSFLTGVTFIKDRYQDMGPLGAIEAGLTASTQHFNLVTACDMPYLTAAAARALDAARNGYDVVVPHVGGYYEPLFALYARSCLEAIRRQLDKGNPKVIDFYGEVAVKTVTEAELSGVNLKKLFKNINTEGDLAEVAAPSDGSKRGV